MIRSEAVILALFGRSSGGHRDGLGVAFADSLQQQGITDLVIPVASLVVFLVLSGLLGLGAASWPARRAASWTCSPPSRRNELGQTTMMTGTIIGRRRVLSPTNLPSALRRGGSGPRRHGPVDHRLVERVGDQLARLFEQTSASARAPSHGW